MLMPKRVKRRSVHRGNMRGKATRGNKLAYGDFGLVTTEPCWIKSNQIEASRIAMTRYTKRTGKVWIKIFPDKPVSKKPAETRMGSGKGSLEFWVAVVKPGRILFEMGDVTEEVAREAFRLASYKLPCKTKFISKETEKIEEAKQKLIEDEKRKKSEDKKQKLSDSQKAKSEQIKSVKSPVEARVSIENAEKTAKYEKSAIKPAEKNAEKASSAKKSENIKAEKKQTKKSEVEGV